jgi:outer membrane receptor protein involved in Fe transport
MDDPDAPLGHHWQDSTHVTFGVATAGLQWRNMKVEGSIFTGREPDENRYDFDRARFDSASGRISWNPTSNLALQFSHGYLKEPEALEPGINLHRTTASVVYNLPLGVDANLATTFVWGQNNKTVEGKTQSFLVESNYQRGRDTFYARAERVEKSGHELALPEERHAKIFSIHSASFGYVRDLTHGRGIDVGLGGQFTISQRPDELDRFYGNEIGYGFEAFFRVRPSRHGEKMHMSHDGTK